MTQLRALLACTQCHMLLVGQVSLQTDRCGNLSSGWHGFATTNEAFTWQTFQDTTGMTVYAFSKAVPCLHATRDVDMC